MSETPTLAAPGTLAGKTIFITGASRGIGLEVAKRCARDGANIVIVAKTADPNPKLPGTIYSAAAEVRPRVAPCRWLWIFAMMRLWPLRWRRRCRLWRNRHSGEQRQRHQPHQHARHTHEAL